MNKYFGLDSERGKHYFWAWHMPTFWICIFFYMTGCKPVTAYKNTIY